MSILEVVKKYGSYKEISPGEYAGPCPECGGAMRFRIKVADNKGRCLFCDFVITGTLEKETASGTEKMLAMIQEAQGRIKSGWRASAWEWLETNAHDVVAFIGVKEKAIDTIFEAGDEKGLVEALQVLERAYQRAWEVYDERPPVIERQEALFETVLPPAER